MLVKTQYEYDAAMEQAIARSRRYGQGKVVYIYHFAALRTVDVDVLEHRHKRTNGITDEDWNIQMPESLEKRVKTKMVTDISGSKGLLPVTWLEGPTSKKSFTSLIKLSESFTSLINFSENFEYEED